MRKTFKSAILFLLIAFTVGAQTYEIQPKVLELEPGWAKTSVNAAIFRKNSVVTHKKHQYVAWYDSAGYVTLAKRKLKQDKWNIVRTNKKGNVYDAHNVISIMVDDDGYLHMAWDHHGGALNYCKSIKPGKLELTENLSMVDSLEDNGVTYPEFYKLPNGDLLFAYRYGASGRGNLVLNRYDTQKKKWSRIHDTLIDGEGERNAYWQMYLDKQGTIHLSWVWRETWDVFTNHDLCYARSHDGGVTWENTDGKKMKLPMTLENAEYALKIPQGSSLINQTSMTADHQGRPYISTYWTPRGEKVPQFFVVFYRDGEWKASQVTNRKMAFSLKGGGSRRIPVSRPQLVFEEKTQALHVIYRDREIDNRICISSAVIDDQINWQLSSIPDIPVGQWEPSYDTELWKNRQRFHLFVQKVGQGSGNEKPEEIEPQMVKILEFDKLPVK